VLFNLANLVVIGFLVSRLSRGKSEVLTVMRA
jgi:hypothetical protein